MSRFADWARRPVVAALVIAVAAVVLGWQGITWWDHKLADDRRDDAVAVAESQVRDLTTMAPDIVDDKLEAMGKRLDGDFKRQFEGFSSTFADAVSKDKIESSGQIVGAAVADYDEDSATVIIASSAQVGQGAQQSVERYWRFQVKLARTDDEWLITQMEFVQ